MPRMEPIACRLVGRTGDSQRSAQYGYLSEHKSFGETDQKAGDYAEDLAATMLATILGVDFDLNSSYDERKESGECRTDHQHGQRVPVGHRRSRGAVDYGGAARCL